MLRIICKETDTNEVVHIQDGQLYIAFKTFEASCPKLEAWINEGSAYSSRQIVGVEVICDELIESPAAEKVEEGK